MPNTDFLAAEHPLYTRRKPDWERDERRMRGGSEVVDTELAAFDWETNGAPGAIDASTRDIRPEVLLNRRGAHLELRKRQAVYLNFMDDVATILVGHVMQKAPVPEENGGLSFGSLGVVRRATDRSVPTRAEQLYYNTNGIGNDGSQWDSFWARVAKHALNTGHRWLMAESPTRPGSSRDDELAGKRPFLIHYSPLLVPNWHYENGELQFAVIKLSLRRPRIENGNYAGNTPVIGKRLLVRKGFDGFGASYAGGGWWDFDQDGKQITERKGDFSATGGAIPFWPHFFERDEEVFSKGTLTELGNVAIAYMNLDSAASYDAWDAASSLLFFLGIDQTQYNAAIDMIASGSKFIPIPMALDKEPPQIYDTSTGAVAQGVFDSRLRSLRDAVRELAGTAAVGGLDASGEAKRVGFADRKSPRLAMMAQELEVSQNTAIHFLEQRWVGANPPSGSVVWSRDFELAPLLDQIGKMFDLEKVTGLQSDTLDTSALLQAMRSIGLVADDATAKKIEAEYFEAGKRRTTIALQRGLATGGEGIDAAEAQNEEQAARARAGNGRPATPEPAGA